MLLSLPSAPYKRLEICYEKHKESETIQYLLTPTTNIPLFRPIFPVTHWNGQYRPHFSGCSLLGRQRNRLILDSVHCTQNSVKFASLHSALQNVHILSRQDEYQKSYWWDGYSSTDVKSKHCNFEPSRVSLQQTNSKTLKQPSNMTHVPWN